jgi:hypothetical protein
MGVTDFKVQLFEGGVKWIVSAGAGADHAAGALSKPDPSQAGRWLRVSEHRVTADHPVCGHLGLERVPVPDVRCDEP